METITDQVGDVNEAPERSEHMQAVPDKAAAGVVGYDQERAEAKPGILEQLLGLFKPVEKVAPVVETGENEFSAAAEAQQQALDALRYILSSALKVTDVPSRWVKFPRHAVSTSAIRVAGFQPNRKRLVIKAVGADVYLGEAADVSADTGYLLATTDAPLEISTQDEIWCISAGSATLHMVGEHYA